MPTLSTLRPFYQVSPRRPWRRWRKIYGESSDPTSPRSPINKRLAHPTNVRGSNFDWILTLNAMQRPITAAEEKSVESPY